MTSKIGTFTMADTSAGMWWHIHDSYACRTHAGTADQRHCVRGMKNIGPSLSPSSGSGSSFRTHGTRALLSSLPLLVSEISHLSTAHHPAYPFHLLVFLKCSWLLGLVAFLEAARCLFAVTSHLPHAYLKRSRVHILWFEAHPGESNAQGNWPSHGLDPFSERMCNISSEVACIVLFGSSARRAGRCGGGTAKRGE